ncbi:hypothetical protein IWX49DRAFT_388301 [Phyllosticta citricarpa]
MCIPRPSASNAPPVPPSVRLVGVAVVVVAVAVKLRRHPAPQQHQAKCQHEHQQGHCGWREPVAAARLCHRCCCCCCDHGRRVFFLEVILVLVHRLLCQHHRQVFRCNILLILRILLLWPSSFYPVVIREAVTWRRKVMPLAVPFD